VKRNPIVSLPYGEKKLNSSTVSSAGTNFGSSPLFSKAFYWSRLIKDYAMTAISRTLAHGDNHFGFCTVSIDHEQAIVDEVPTCVLKCVDRWSRRIGFWVVALSRRVP
jgi:hypothetical protein